MERNAKSVTPSLVQIVYLCVPLGAYTDVYSTKDLNCVSQS